MVPREYTALGDGRRHRVVPPPTLLRITFVHTTGGRLSGLLEPYTDPDCDCLVVTAFAGSMTGNDRFEGTFRTRQVGGTEYHSGRWEVRRRKEK